MAGDAQNNDVWSTLGSGASSALGKILDYKLESQKIRTTAAPSGSVANQGPNPFPGTQSAYPQNDTKPSFGNPFSSLPSWAIGLIVVGVVLLVLGFARR